MVLGRLRPLGSSLSTMLRAMPRRQIVHVSEDLPTQRHPKLLRSAAGSCCYRRRTMSTSSTTKKPRADPMAKRPNKLCDPYGQGGKPLSMNEVEHFMSTIDKEWEIEYDDDGDNQHNDDGSGTPAPLAIKRTFIHKDFLSAARFSNAIAAVAQMNAHFPSILLDRRIVRKNWETVSVVRCHTLVLGGLSTHDFHLAMLVDVEVCRPEVASLIVKE